MENIIYTVIYIAIKATMVLISLQILKFIIDSRIKRWFYNKLYDEEIEKQRKGE